MVRTSFHRVSCPKKLLLQCMTWYINSMIKNHIVMGAVSLKKWGDHAPQLGLSRKLGYEFMSQSALAALTVIADMTCPMDVEFHLCVLAAHI